MFETLLSRMLSRTVREHAEKIFNKGFLISAKLGYPALYRQQQTGRKTA
jgi:hypothetical protein